jgi:magnesium transporter
MAEIVEGLDSAARERINLLRRARRFFWIDLLATEVSREEIQDALGIPPHALGPLLDFGREIPPSRKFHADGEHVVFPFTAFLEAESVEGGVARLEPLDVHVLVHGDYVLTIHREGPPLPPLLAGYTPAGRTEQYVVYAVLDAMLATAFDALNNVQLAIEGLQLASAEIVGARVRMGTLREASRRLATMRRQLGPQQGIFERISQEIGQVSGLEADSEHYFDRIHEQLNRLVDAIDAASDSMAQLVDLRLNETIYWLTVVATIFLPLTFLTGFFGMNFGWLVRRIDTVAAFALLGVGLPLLLGVLTYFVIQRRGSPVPRDPNSVERAIGSLARAGVGAVPRLVKPIVRSR